MDFLLPNNTIPIFIIINIILIAFSFILILKRKQKLTIKLALLIALAFILPIIGSSILIVYLYNYKDLNLIQTSPNT